MSSLQPLGENIVARPVEAKRETASGIVLPDSAKEGSKQAEVIAVGKEVKEISPGDVIIYKEFAAHQVKLDGQDYLIIPAADVLAVVVESAKLRK